MEADSNGTSPGPAQETQPAREAGEARATALQKARRRCIGKAGLTTRFPVTIAPQFCPQILCWVFIFDIHGLCALVQSGIYSCNGKRVHLFLVVTQAPPFQLNLWVFFNSTTFWTSQATRENICGGHRRGIVLGDSIDQTFLCNVRKRRIERPNVGGVYTRSRNGSPSRKRYEVNGQMTKAISQ